MKTWILKVVSAVVAALCMTLPVNAAPVTWTLHNVVFADGETATGSFVYDADTSAFSLINVSTTLGGVSYIGFADAGSSSLIKLVAVALPPFTGVSALFFQLTSPMTNAGGTIALDSLFPGTQSTCDNADCSSLSGSRFIASGEIITASTPIPGAIPLFASGLGVLGLMAWRRKRRA